MNSESLQKPAKKTSHKATCINVEVAYARPDIQQVVTVTLPPGSTIADAIKASGLLERFPEIDLNTQAVGIFSQLKKIADPVQSGDRVEIYRPLIADPKSLRRRRAEQQRKQGVIR